MSEHFVVSVGFQCECWSAPRCSCLEHPVLINWHNREGRRRLQCGLTAEGAARSEDSHCSSLLRGFKGESALPWFTGPLLGYSSVCSQAPVCRALWGRVPALCSLRPLITLPDQLAPPGAWHLSYFTLFSGSGNCNPAASRPLPPREEEVQRGL